MIFPSPSTSHLDFVHPYFYTHTLISCTCPRYTCPSGLAKITCMFQSILPCGSPWLTKVNFFFFLVCSFSGVVLSFSILLIPAFINLRKGFYFVYIFVFLFEQKLGISISYLYMSIIITCFSSQQKGKHKIHGKP